MSKLLIADDDKNLRYSFRTLMKKEGYEVDEAPDGPTAIGMVRSREYDAVVMDIRMPGMSGLDAFTKIQEERSKLPVIITTAYGTTETAIEAMRRGAYDYVLKPFNIGELKRIIASAIADNRLIRDVVRLPDEPRDGSGAARIIGSSPQMQEVYKLIGKVSRTDTTALITGPSGSGKELVARAIFHYSSRRDKPFQAVNCVALPEQLLETELFGHEKGAFTGAYESRIGRFERCDGGTLFLDEIGDMPLLMQAKILRVLQERSFERIGGRRTITVDVRLIAATNKDLLSLVAKGLFREDLYYRLRVVNIQIPPLSDRKSDIPELVDYFMRRFNRSRKLPIEGITKEAVEFLKMRHWPGNVRELENTIQRAVVLCPGQVLRLEDFEFLSDDGKQQQPAYDGDLRKLTDQLVKRARTGHGIEIIPEMERLLIEAALRETGGNQVQAAKLLGISRNTLRNRISKFDIK
jgi:nitrogen regulation protein NR(I)